MPEGDSNTRYWRVQRTRPSIVASPGVEGRINLRWDLKRGRRFRARRGGMRRHNEGRGGRRPRPAARCKSAAQGACTKAETYVATQRICCASRAASEARLQGDARAGGRQSERKSAVARMARGDQAVMASLSAPTTTLATRGARGARSATAGAPARIASPAAHLLRRRLSSTHRSSSVFS